MKISELSFWRQSLERLREIANRFTHNFDEPPLRSELFSAAQMEQYGKRLAAVHVLTQKQRRDHLLMRLAANETVLINACTQLTAAAKENQPMTPASEWLLDNFYLIEEHIRTAKRHLPKGYSRELPRLLNGLSAGLPRVYGMALEVISHGDGRVDPESLTRFVAAYQTVSVLKLGELWAIPIMLRLALIENLRRVAVRIVIGKAERDIAAQWAEQMTVVAEQDPKSLVLVIADMARSQPPMTPAFVSEFARRLQGHGLALALPLTWIEQVLAESGSTIAQLVQSGNQQQAADQVSISNSIASLRFLGSMDWRTFVETMSKVEQTLRTDPADVYVAMDFSTRDLYRHAVERLAKNSDLSETEIARNAIELAHAARRNNGDLRTTHVGYYLIDEGLRDLEKIVQVRFPLSQKLAKIGAAHPLFFYLGAITLLTLLGTAGLMALTSDVPLEIRLLLLPVALLATSQLALSLVNWALTVWIRPTLLPRMDFSTGIPVQSRTLVVVPTMLVHSRGVENLVEDLEVRFLANRDQQLYFGLLTDFCDAPTSTTPEDESLLRLAQARIEALNQKYATQGHDIFFLFHRPRRWNPQERVWMGYERKRGKLGDLNALLRGQAEERFSCIVGDISGLTNVKYVITLDTDTQLPRDTARRLVSAMAHPLNNASYSAPQQRVCAGYGILQPRVSASLEGANRSYYARLFSFDSGIDPYTRAVSDVYQDVFSEGSFIGKGIYAVDTFEQALNARFPENRILSHDLLEGCYARSGLLSDVHLQEDYPAHYLADVSRRHRWIRGDWQLTGWLRRRVPGPTAQRLKNPLSGLSRWKLWDNLRRSLVPITLVILLLWGWAWLAAPALWTMAVLGILLLPPLLATVVDGLRKPREVRLRQHLAATLEAAAQRFSQAIFFLVCLPYEAYFSLDAILRTLGRLLFTHRRLLEWNPSGEAARNCRTDLSAIARTMWIAPLTAVTTALCLAILQPSALASAAIILFLWLAAPVIVWWMGKPRLRRVPHLTREQNIFLHKLARKTWAFFEHFCGEKDHWLPPDNYQEYRTAMVAHRTSPTNIGMALLANLAAYDFGYIPAGQLLERTANTLRTMQSLQRYRGHFYNWYDTLSLQPLHPKYVSTVDSGNLAGHLLTLRAGLCALADAPLLGPRVFEGLRTTLAIVTEIATPYPSSLRAEFDTVCASNPHTLEEVWQAIERLARCTTQYVSQFNAGSRGEAYEWAQRLAQQCQRARDELVYLAPWLALPERDIPQLKISALPTLREIAQLTERVLAHPEHADDAVEQERHSALLQCLLQAAARARTRLSEIEQLAEQANAFAQMEFDFLYDSSTRLLAIGYNVDDLRRDTSYYDLLASEARLVSFVAIAQGQLPQESWFALGRLLTSAGGEPLLMSWSGSMFEYLMPLLVMPTFDYTLLDQTYKAAVARQMDYGRQRGVAWGISESGYNLVDAHFNYQYRAFGVPGLGFKRGLADDLVIAPYASALALMVAPEAACANLQRLAAEGVAGKFGLYEAVDYTPSRQRRGESHAVVRSYMAHHQGMSLLAMAYLLLDRPMQQRFTADPQLQATLLLLQERIPKTPVLFPHTAQFPEPRALPSPTETSLRIFNNPDTPLPEVQLLSNGRYHVMISHAGGGYSRWKDLAVTRWREDATCDTWGTFCYLHDISSGETWSTAYQPTRKLPPQYAAIFSEGRAEFRRRDTVGQSYFETYTEIVVSPEDDIELRRVHLTNRTESRRTLTVTSYAEVVLAPPAADALHPAFSNLFVQTEIIAPRQAILCTRRPRSRHDQIPWMLHLMAVHGAKIHDISYETDHMQFIGRGRTAADAQALSSAAASSSMLSNTQGSVLDPIVAIRYTITLEPQQIAIIDMVTGVADSRAAALNLVEKYQDRRLADRVFELAWTHAQVVLRQINVTEADVQLYGRLANSVVYANASLRADANILLQNRRGQSGLWGYAISGDLPIVLVQIGSVANIELVRQLVQAHAYWRLKGLAVDLVIWNEDRASYRQVLQEQILDLISSGIESHIMDRPGGIFVRSADQIPHEDRILFQAVARIILSDTRGTLAEQLSRRSSKEMRVPRLQPTRHHRLALGAGAVAEPRRDLILYNGLGGFTPDGHEYVITTTATQLTPAPWVNVLANPYFGTVISEQGQAYTWSENAHEFRLTPWHNDPVSDIGGEAFYLRDEESGHFWSPTPLPTRGTDSYVSRHGFGYSVFEHNEGGIISELWVYVSLEAAVKFSVLKVRNASGRPRRLSATGYVEWVLGDLRAKSSPHIITEVDADTGILFARNRYNAEFADRIAFFDVDDTQRTLTCDRTEFIGRNGSLKNPAALARARLSGKTGTALDPCAALQVNFDLAEGQEREVVFRLGLAGRHSTDEARQWAQNFRGSATAHAALEAVWRYWNRTLGAVQVETPDAALNVLTNGWLVYQTLACRFWARSGYYQSGGAFGFRDQLQDGMALIHAEPARVRAHLLLSAAHQFLEGDVQHWWHPPSNRGVRTHCSDDYLWLPLAVSRYVLTTGDTGVLDEPVGFLEGRPVSPGDDSYYDLPNHSNETASLYEHCVRALRHGLRFGEHGLPLIGSGDWNDGMNLVGIHGKGESVWLGFFLYDVLMRFSVLAERRGDTSFAQECHTQATRLRQCIADHAWDGGWYRRAYFDDGSALGSAANQECQIDSISQSWSVLSGAGDDARARQAMEAVYARLVRPDAALIQLLDPPFDTSEMDPGYIKGYVPGVRENGGQYTHAAIWTTMAFAALGDNARAWELLRMINPVNHAKTAGEVALYKVEPYVVAADVYAVAPHTGRGGWSWYTGSAGWMYRLITESLLGLQRVVDKLYFTPCLPPDWPAFTVHYRYQETVYHITVTQILGTQEHAPRVTIDGIVGADAYIPLIDDQRDHTVEIAIHTVLPSNSA